MDEATQERVKKLPVWARNLIINQEHTIGGLKEQLRDEEEPKSEEERKGRIFTDPNGKDDVPVFLPRYEAAVIQLSENRRDRITVRFSEPMGELEIIGGRSMRIQPYSTNLMYVSLKG